PPSGALQCCSMVRSPNVPVHAPVTQASCSTVAFRGGAAPAAACPCVSAPASSAAHPTITSSLSIRITRSPCRRSVPVRRRLLRAGHSWRELQDLDVAEVDLAALGFQAEVALLPGRARDAVDE